jgi:small subunit ribosomal protein S1
MTQRNSDKSDSFAALFEAQGPAESATRKKPLALGARVRAEVVLLTRDGAFAEVLEQGPGKRPQAFVGREDLLGPGGEVAVQVGEVLEAVVVDLGGGAHGSGTLRLGRSMGKPAGLAELETAHAAGVAVEGKVSGVNKGGLEVEVAGVRAFCPISQADRGFVADPQTLVGRTLRFMVSELRDGGKRVVLSRRAALAAEAKEASARVLAELKPGAIVRGTISAVREFGAFVDLGGIEGLIPNAELSYDRSQKASDVLNAGDAVEVQVRELKEATDKRGAPTTKITLSLKALSADPWLSVDAQVPVGRVMRGTVTRLQDFGAFVRLAAGLEGLLHVSELPGKVSHPSAVLKVGDTIDVVVRSVDAGTRRIALAPAPEGLAVGDVAQGLTLFVGSIVTGKVERVESFGVFLQIDGTRGRVGRGLIPNVELGTQRGADTRKLFPVGAPLQAKVLETGENKLRLSLRAIKDDEERSDFDGYRERSGAASGFGTLADLLKNKG